MSNYFNPFPLIGYNFGNESYKSVFQNITTYVGIIDELKDQSIFYSREFIRDGERPDSLSYRLYGTTDYYWTFYFLNESLRESGWPIPARDILKYAKKYYPNQVVKVTTDISDKFFTGQSVEGLGSGTTGTILKKNMNLGQIIIRTNNGESFIDGEVIQANSDTLTRILVQDARAQYNAIHHYEDTGGNWVDINPFVVASGSGLIPITNLNRLEARNEELRQIDVFTPEVVSQVQSEFNRFIRL